MGRPLLSLWWVYWPLLCIIPGGIALVIAIDQPQLAGVVGAAAAAPLAGPGYKTLRRLACTSRTFRTVTNRRVVLHYAPTVSDAVARDWLAECRQVVERLDDQFGSPPRLRPAVFVLSSSADMVRVYDGTAGAFAMPRSRSIVGSADLMTSDVYQRETLLHEFGHLYSYRLNPGAPAWLAEGLSVWLQETYCGRPTDAVARAYASDGGPPLAELLNRQAFYHDAQRTYALAGSFVGNLIRRHGWPAFRRLYRGYDGFRTSRTVFQRRLGIDFDKAVRQWQGELLMPDSLRRRLGMNLGEASSD